MPTAFVIIIFLFSPSSSEAAALSGTQSRSNPRRYCRHIFIIFERLGRSLRFDEFMNSGTSNPQEDALENAVISAHHSRKQPGDELM